MRSGFVATRHIKKSKVSRQCAFCKRTIEIGEPAVRFVGGNDCTDFGSMFHHPLCQKMHNLGFTGEELDEDNPYHA